eukprot:10087307-Alexandrium_andersonii.AAC.1
MSGGLASSARPRRWLSTRSRRRLRARTALGLPPPPPVLLGEPAEPQAAAVDVAPGVPAAPGQAGAAAWLAGGGSDPGAPPVGDTPGPSQPQPLAGPAADGASVASARNDGSEYGVG